MLNIQDISSSRFTLKVVGASPELPSGLEKEVEGLWQAEQERRGKEMFNGRIMSASIVSQNGIHGFIAQYRHLIAQQARPELFDALRVRPVAVSGLLICADGIVFGRRSDSLTQDAGFWELVPSGGIDTTNISDTSEVSYLSQVLTELSEETGINSEFVSSALPFCLVEDTHSHVLDIGIALETSLSHNEVLLAHRETATKEYDELRILPRSEIDEFITNSATQIVEVSAALIQCFQKRETLLTGESDGN